MESRRLRVKFLCLWAVATLAKLVLAWRLPLLVDEAFYAWEGRHPAWAYSDLPGMTAWLVGLGRWIGGAEPLAIRAPFLVLGALLPWLVVRLAGRWFGPEAAWRAGILAVLMPLSGWLGVLALPDVPLVIAALVCLDGLAQCRERIGARGLAVLAAGLVLGAFSHYRFAVVVLAGMVGLLLDPAGRPLLRRPAFWLALAIGAAAWWPLMDWNLRHAEAGLRFQLFERHPWRFHGDAWTWLPIQALLLTPPLFALLLATARVAWRRRKDRAAPWGLLAGIALVSVGAFFVLGFFADSQRVSFHWPLAGWLALLLAAPVVAAPWAGAWRRAVPIGAALGWLLVGAWLALAASPDGRRALAGTALYPEGFAGWSEIGRRLRADPPPRGARVLAEDFELAAQAAFALDRDDIGVLDHPLNHKHGRAAQLQAWGLAYAPTGAPPTGPAWLLVADDSLPMKQRLRAYHQRCARFGRLPLPDGLSVDHGRKRFWIYRFDGEGDGDLGQGDGRARPCAAPALAWIDAPADAARVTGSPWVRGWAFKDPVGLARVEILLDGRVVATARYGLDMPQVAAFWRDSSDPAQPKVGFEARIPAAALTPGRHWLGLRLHGRDGSVEDGPEQRLVAP